MQYNVSGTLIAAFNGCRAQIVQGLGSQAQDWLRNLQGPAQNENLFSLFKNNSGFQDGNRRAFNQVWDPVWLPKSYAHEVGPTHTLKKLSIWCKT